MEGAAKPEATKEKTKPNVPSFNSFWTIPSDIGRRYAAVSGDSNPIHLYNFTAKLFGFPRAIAHGMWTKAKCLSMYEGRLPDAFEVEFGCDVLNTISRAHCSDHEILQCLDENWKHSCKEQKIFSTAAGAFSACSKLDRMFDFDKFAKLFARQIIPAQLARERSLVLFNPARLSFVGMP